MGKKPFVFTLAMAAASLGMAQERPMAVPHGKYESRPGYSGQIPALGIYNQAPSYGGAGSTCQDALTKERQLNGLLREKIRLLEIELAKVQGGPQAGVGK